MSLEADSQLLLAALLRLVRRLHGTFAAQKAWLEELQQHALIGGAKTAKEAVAELQGFISNTIGSDGTSTQWICSMDPSTVASLCEAALRTLEADEEAGGAGLSISGDSRGFDFSGRPCVMG